MASDTWRRRGPSLILNEAGSSLTGRPGFVVLGVEVAATGYRRPMTGFQMELPDCVRRVEGVGGLPALAVDGPVSSGVIQLQGAQVTSFVPHDGEELLWLSPIAEAGSQKAIRGGVPVCFPWFGAGRDGRMKPSHGLARLARWRVVGVDQRDDAVTVSLVVTPDTVAQLEGAERWPDGLFAELHVTFGTCLALEFVARNEGAEETSFELALHTYLAVDDVRRVAVAGLDGAPMLDQVTGERGVVNGDIAFSGEVDLAITAPGRTIEVIGPRGPLAGVERDGLPDAVVWNPHVDKAARLEDVPDDAWPGFVCVEAAALGSDAVGLPAGGTCLLRATYAPAR